MSSAQCSRRLPSSKEREHTGMAIKTIARDFAIGEKADQRKLAKTLPNERGFHPGLAEQCCSARDTTDIDPSFRRGAEPPGELAHHPHHIAACTLGVAAADQVLVDRR